MDAACRNVLAPEKDRCGIANIKEIIAVKGAEIEHLRCLAGPSAYIAALRGDWTKPLEEVVADVLQCAERAAAAVLQDRSSSRLVPKMAHLFGHQVKRIAPGYFSKLVASAFAP